ncbi:MAG: hypothetical protein ACYTHM_21430 [Planctomycetota bacterium]|jgi:hypothetical protein
MDSENASSSKEEIEEILGTFPKAEAGWCRINSVDLPSLFLPSNVFQWGESCIYYAFFAVRRNAEEPSKPVYVLHVTAIDLEARRKDPEIARLAEDGWCIPMAYEGEDPHRALLNRLGFGEGWADAFDVFTLVIPNECEDWVRKMFSSETLCLYEEGKEMGSKVVDFERTVVARFPDLFAQE